VKLAPGPVQYVAGLQFAGIVHAHSLTEIDPHNPDSDVVVNWYKLEAGVKQPSQVSANNTAHRAPPDATITLSMQFNDGRHTNFKGYAYIHHRISDIICKLNTCARTH
jgi:hypothetical protein